MQLCISNGRIVDPAQRLDGIGTLWVKDGRVAAIVMEDGRVLGQLPEGCGGGACHGALTAKDCGGAEAGKGGTAGGGTAKDCGGTAVAIPTGWKHMDAAGKWVAPGFIDLHVHFREPGQEYKEDIASGCRAAARGGFTTVCCMPNTLPAIDSAETVLYVDRKAAAARMQGSEQAAAARAQGSEQAAAAANTAGAADGWGAAAGLAGRSGGAAAGALAAAAAGRGAAGIRVLPVGAITDGQKGIHLADIKAMAEAKTEASRAIGRGICAISEDGRSVADAALMLAGMKEAAALNLPVFSHAEDPTLPGTPLGEDLMVARDILLAVEAGCRLHFCHVSTAGSVEMIRQARAAGLPVTGEAAPHHFTLDSRDEQGNSNRKMNPPLRRPEDAEALRQALADGTLTAIATDHAPHHSSEKDVPFAQAANGVVGLETSFGASYTKLVRNGSLTPLDLVRLMSTGPAEILGLPASSLAPGQQADVVILDVKEEYTVRAEDFLSKGKNSAFLGMKFYGRAVCTLAAGRVIWEEKAL